MTATQPKLQLKYGILVAGLVISCLLGIRTSVSGPTAADSADINTGAATEETLPETGGEAAVPEEPVLTRADLPEISFTVLSPEDASCDALRYLAHFDALFVSEEDWAVPANRAEAVTILYCLSGEAPAAEAEVPYADVSAGDAYFDAMAWATDAGLLKDFAGDCFEPRRFVTREELAVLLSRYAERCGVDVSGKPLDWAVKQGLYRTFVSEELLPDMAVSQLQLAHAAVGVQALCGEPLAQELFAALPAREEMTGIAQANHDTVQSKVDAVAAKYGAVGLQVAVLEGGRVTDTYSYGWAEKNTTPLTAEHKLRCASISKVLVGVTAMLLREEGTVSLDADISDYWGFPVQNPYYPDETITIRSMLNHTSSIVNAGDGTSRLYADVSQKLQSAEGYSNLKPGAGRSWSYNNYAFATLGMTLEQAAGEFTDDILRRRIFDAMGIDAAYFHGELEQTELLANLYRANGRVGLSVKAQLAMVRGEFPGSSGEPFPGGLTISAKNLAKVAGLLANDGVWEGVRLMDAESVELMESACFSLGGSVRQGMPLRTCAGLYGRETLAYHTGSAFGAYNFFSYDPTTGDGVVVLTSGTDGSKKDANGIYAAAGEISAYLYAFLKDGEPPEEAPVEQAAPVEENTPVEEDVSTEGPGETVSEGEKEPAEEAAENAPAEEGTSANEPVTEAGSSVEESSPAEEEDPEEGNAPAEEPVPGEEQPSVWWPALPEDMMLSESEGLA